MSSIEDWNKAQKDSFFYEDPDSPEIGLAGDLKVHNPTHDPEQRRYWESTKSPYKKKVEIVVFAHGKDKNNDDITLIVLCVQLTCTKESRFKSVELGFKFQAKDLEKDLEPLEVVSWAPFNAQERYKTGEETIHSRTHFDGNVGIEKGGPKIGVSGGKEKERTYQKEMYARAQSDPDVDEESGLVTGVQWYFAEAENQKDGVPPNFHLAMVVKAPVCKESRISQRFTGKLRIRVDAGPREALHRFFCERERDNHPVIFNPGLPLRLYSNGERVRGLLQHDNGVPKPLSGYVGDGLLTIIEKINEVTS